MVRIAGVDEAGRGCVIGPLVVAGVAFMEEDLPRLTEIGVKDSKRLTPRRREALEGEIMDLSSGYSFFDLEPWMIDHVVSRSVPLRRLNYLTGMAMAKVVRDLEPEIVFMDPSDVRPQRCVEQMRAVLPFNPSITCEPKADLKYPAVSAASILAKVRRDRFVAELREEYGDFNSGYSSDRKTIKWLEDWFREHDECPPFVRRSWATVRRIMKRG